MPGVPVSAPARGSEGAGAGSEGAEHAECDQDGRKRRSPVAARHGGLAIEAQKWDWGVGPAPAGGRGARRLDEAWTSLA